MKRTQKGAERRIAEETLCNKLKLGTREVPTGKEGHRRGRGRQYIENGAKKGARQILRQYSTVFKFGKYLFTL